MSDHEVLAPGTRFGRYELIRFIGAGGMGTVYEALHIDLKKRVAFKALHSSVAQSEEALTRFLREGEVASRIRHPNVVEVFDVGIECDIPYLVMELLEGEDLATVLERDGCLPLSRVANVMLPVLAAVATAHEKGVLHRDLKPENIFLAKSPHGLITPKLLDFGISKLIDPDEALRLTGAAALVGTPKYVSPEQATKARVVDARSDQYSLGVLLYECVTNAEPFYGETLYDILHAIVAGNFLPPSAHRPDLQPEFEAIILRAMSTEPEFRFPDVPTMGRALLPFADQRDQAIWSPAFEPARPAGAPLAPSVRPPPPERQGQPSTLSEAAAEVPAGERISKRWGGPWGLGLGALLAATAVGLLLLGPSELVQTVVRAFDDAPPKAASGPSPSEQVQVVAPMPSSDPPNYWVRVTVTPSHASLSLDGNWAGKGSLNLLLPKDGSPHVLEVSAEGYVQHTIHFEDAPPPDSIALELLPEGHSPQRAERATRSYGRSRANATRPHANRAGASGTGSRASSVEAQRPGAQDAARRMLMSRPAPVEFSPNRAPIVD